jgi:hypothetical protein
MRLIEEEEVIFESYEKIKMLIILFFIYFLIKKLNYVKGMLKSKSKKF